MPGLKYINRLSQINQLINLKITGSPKELAYKLGISERQVYKYISDLKELGAEINFSSNCNSYIFNSEFTLKIFSPLN